MKILVVSDDRVPSGPSHPGGLGKSAYEICAGLCRKFDSVFFAALDGSDVPDGATFVPIGEYAGGWKQYDAILDSSHQHQLSMLYPSAPVLNRVGDRELKRRVPNTVVNSPYMQETYGGRLVNTGIVVDHFPNGLTVGDDPLLFTGGHFLHRGIDIALHVATEAQKEIRFIRGVPQRELLEYFRESSWLLHPSNNNAAPRTPLEAAACGLPTLCLTGDGAEHHVKDGVTGFVCENVDEMVKLVMWHEHHDFVPEEMRDWVTENHSYDKMVDDYVNLIVAVADGERW